MTTLLKLKDKFNKEHTTLIMKYAPLFWKHRILIITSTSFNPIKWKSFLIKRRKHGKF